MSCSRFQVFSAEELVLDMATVKEHEWSCRDMRELRVQFKDLCNAELIEECLRDVCFHRKHASRFNNPALNLCDSPVSRCVFYCLFLTSRPYLGASNKSSSGKLKIGGEGRVDAPNTGEW